MTNIYFIAGIIIECVILVLLAVFKKLSGRAFAVIALITALCCGAVGFLDTRTQKTQEQTDIRSYVYMAARLIQEDHPAESLELMTDISEKDGAQYGSRPLKALAYNLNGAYMAAERTLGEGDLSDTEQDLLDRSVSRRKAGEELRDAVLDDVFSLIGATEKETAGWETEMKVRFMGLKLTDEEKAATDSKLALAKNAITDYRREEAFRIMTENTSGIREAVIVSEMYRRGFSNLIMADTDEEYGKLWKEATELQAELNLASLSLSSDENEGSGEEDAEAAAAEEEYEKINARYRIAQTALNDETTRRSINYLETYGSTEGNESAGFELQKAMLYFNIRQKDDARKCLDEVFFGDELTDEDWLGTDIEAFKEAFIIFLSDSTDQEYSVLFDNLIKSLYQGLFEGVPAQFKTFVMEYMKEKMSGLTIRHVDADEYPTVTADIYLSNTDRVLDKGKITVTDNGSEIKDFTLEQVEVTDLSIVFVLDKSGSMSGDRMEQSKDAIRNSISQIESGVLMGLVSFDNEATVECALTDSSTAVRSCVDGIQAEGGTNISSGLSAGIGLLSGQPGTKVIIFLSDGYGADSPDMINSVTAEAASQGIIIYTVGLLGCDENTMMNISLNTDGQFIMVEDTAMLSSTYNDIQNAMTNSYRLTYQAPDDKEYRKITVVDTDQGKEAARFYSTVREEDPKNDKDKDKETDDTQAADYFKQIGGSEGGR